MDTCYKWYWMEASIIHTTDKALLIESDEYKKWIPYTAVKASDGDLEKGNTCGIAITYELASEKGFIQLETASERL